MADKGPNIICARPHAVINRLGISSLDAADRARAARIGNERRRVHFMAGRALLRDRLSSSVEHAVQPATWRLKEGKYGKPCVAPDLPQIHFSISHAPGLIAIATSPVVAVGIDLEPVTGAKNTDPVTDQLSPRERTWLEQQPEAGRWASFLKLWTCKEAVSKLLETGCTVDFTAIELDVPAGLALRPDNPIADGHRISIDHEVVEFEDDLYSLGIASMKPTMECSSYLTELFMPPSMDAPAFL